MDKPDLATDEKFVVAEAEVAQRHCLNLHTKYAPEWGVWEVARELYANAYDAAREDMSVQSPDRDTLIIRTPTVPDLGDVFIMGCGSKTQHTDTIGQFGEGLKLAALVATRNPDSSITMSLPGQRVSFEIGEHFGQPVLFAVVEGTDDEQPGYAVTLNMKGAGAVLESRIIDGSQSRPIAKADADPVRIYCRGIYICDLDQKDALHSYNLNGIRLNRDRDMADPFWIKMEVGCLLIKSLDETLATKLVKAKLSWECEECLSVASHHAGAHERQMLADAFKKHRPRGVISTGLKASSQASERGYEPVPVGQGLAELLSGLIPRDIDIIPRDADLTPVDEFPEHWQDMLEELMRLAEMVESPSVTVRVFEDDTHALGMAVPGKRLIWLNARLMHYDMRFERVRTFAHELGHIMGNGADASETFEESLDLLCAKLALMVLDTP